MLIHEIAYSLLLATIISIARRILLYSRSPLRRFPGPPLAGFTNLWRTCIVWRGDSHLTVRTLHHRYGPVVRTGPNTLELDIPELVKTIYNAKGDFPKTEFYHGSSVLGPERRIIYNLFSESNNDIQANKRRPIMKYYTLHNSLHLEPLMDATMSRLCNELENRYTHDGGGKTVCNLGNWILFFAWDVVGEATFSQPFGYLEKGHDFDGKLRASERAVKYFAIVGQIPILDLWLDKNPIYRLGPPSMKPVVDVAIKRLMDHVQERAVQGKSRTSDFLDKFIDAQSEHAEIVDNEQIISYLMINMLAGADTVASAVRATLYYCIRDKAIWQRLQNLIPACSEMIQYKQARKIPYLEACIREAIRLEPPVCMPLERYVPQSGLKLPTGEFMPPGTAVGMNSYILGRNKSLFGDDVDDFIPERWLQGQQESNDDFLRRLQAINDADLTFGAGNRTCIGKHLGLIKTYKVVATLVARFEMELVDSKQWKVTNYWFLKQEGLNVRMKRRI